MDHLAAVAEDRVGYRRVALAHRREAGVVVGYREAAAERSGAERNWGDSSGETMQAGPHAGVGVEAGTAPGQASAVGADVGVAGSQLGPTVGAGEEDIGLGAEDRKAAAAGVETAAGGIRRMSGSGSPVSELPGGGDRLCLCQQDRHDLLRFDMADTEDSRLQAPRGQEQEEEDRSCTPWQGGLVGVAKCRLGRSETVCEENVLVQHSCTDTGIGECSKMMQLARGSLG